MVWSLLIVGTIVCFGMKLDMTKMTLTFRTGVCLCCYIDSNLLQAIVQLQAVK